MARALVFGASAAAHPQMTSDALRNMEASRVRGHQEPSDHGARGSKHSFSPPFPAEKATRPPRAPAP